MTDEDMIGYVLDLLEPAERRAVEHHIAANPDAAGRVAQLRATIAPLAVDREPPEPPAGLRVRTVAKLAEYIVAHEPNWKDSVPNLDLSRTTLTDTAAIEPSRRGDTSTEIRHFRSWFRADLVVAAGIGLVIAGLVISGISRSRSEYGVLACKNNLMKLHQTLVNYTETHNGHYPLIGDDSHQTAGTFSAALHEENHDPTKAGFTWHCPGSARPDPTLLDVMKNGWRDEVPSKVQYAYSLGYRDADKKLHGLSHHGEEGSEHDLTPIAGDFPAEGTVEEPGPFSPHGKGHNVLYVGGNVRYMNTAKAGVGGDDIFHNQEGRVAAGLNRNDSVLGRPGDRP